MGYISKSYDRYCFGAILQRLRFVWIVWLVQFYQICFGNTVNTSDKTYVSVYRIAPKLRNISNVIFEPNSAKLLFAMRETKQGTMFASQPINVPARLTVVSSD